MLFIFCRWVCRQLLWLWCRGPVEGREHLPARGGALIVCNHASYLDPPALGSAVCRPMYFMAKAELFTVPLIRWLMPRINSFPVRRGAPDLAALREAVRLLQAGHLVGMFIEGTRSQDGRLGEPQPGAAMVALRAGVPVVPAAVLGGDQVLPPGTVRPRRGRISVRFGKPFIPDPGDAQGRARLEPVGEQMMRAIAALLPPERRGRWEA